MKIKSLILAIAVLASSVSFAQRAPGRPGGDNLERRVQELERALWNQERRLQDVERILQVGTPVPQPSYTDVSCLIVDKGYGKTFLGTGRNKIESEADVRQKCGSSTHPTYCNGEVKCSSGITEAVRGYLCIVTDKGYGKTFKGEGTNAIEAEAKAKQSCESATHPSYCGAVTARCEAF